MVEVAHGSTFYLDISKNKMKNLEDCQNFLRKSAKESMKEDGF